jgi:hypothetical protein
VLPEPADDLLRGTVLRVVGGGHIGVEFRGQGPGLRPSTATSTNRTARASCRKRPRGSAVSGSTPATHTSYASPSILASSMTCPSGSTVYRWAKASGSAR